MVKKFDGEFPDRFAEEIYNYLTIPESEYPIASHCFDYPIVDREYFSDLADTFRSPHLWAREKAGWKLRRTAWSGS